ncbi:PRTRC system ThiF family protein [Chitinophaga pinensis]|uniref:UBA/THIF-type NAD/FAD binding protein n=1 Tax=Chitinophaga pinensis (strain ATCC 43595 / DSM 2588 / LMG 13176 / NBRC 15968 / NCIMB 11800 / UQM 2034) TaxID=485918 RepID=A0A979G4R7_CHIPD|nr:PRTRC system ThiF family protein [Chitinophaga pinensis]ACU60701.1 UBA/THIF-type NAD/FAD binding protein [Chitinophaga pinensis DSM 2588]
MKKIHFTEQYLLRPTNPVTVNLIGCGGNGSSMVQWLTRINYCLRELEHPGLQVRVFDGDVVTHNNRLRQGFLEDEVGMNKAAALVARYNRCSGTRWQAYDCFYSRDSFHQIGAVVNANITIGCVDNVPARYEIIELIKRCNSRGGHHRDQPFYYMDLGNTRNTGQYIFSTVNPIKQITSPDYETVNRLSFITDLYGDLLQAGADSEEQGPSCSAQEALHRQDLFVNPIVGVCAGRYLWKLFSEYHTFSYGGVVNLHTERFQPLMIE